MKKKIKEETKKTNACICKICNKIIFMNVDDYCHLEDYCQGNFLMDGWFHLKCYNDKLKGEYSRSILKKAFEMVGINPDKTKEVLAQQYG